MTHSKRDVAGRRITSRNRDAESPYVVSPLRQRHKLLYTADCSTHTHTRARIHTFGRTQTALFSARQRVFAHDFVTFPAETLAIKVYTGFLNDHARVKTLRCTVGKRSNIDKHRRTITSAACRFPRFPELPAAFHAGDAFPAIVPSNKSGTSNIYPSPPIEMPPSCGKV